MTDYKYRFCRYLPSLSDPDTYYDFAVIIGSANAIALVGVDLSAFGLVGTNPIARSMLDNSFNATWNSIARTMDENPFLLGAKVLEKLDNRSLTNFLITPIEVCQSEKPIDEAGGEIFENLAGQLLRDANYEYTPGVHKRHKLHAHACTN